MSDVLDRFLGLGKDSLRWSLVSSLAFCFIATFCYVRAARSLKGDLARSHELN
jgi:hypothetical protein